jgi:glycine cleavage system H lipoate-binding protein
MKAKHIQRFIGYPVLAILTAYIFLFAQLPAKAQGVEQISIQCEEGLSSLLNQWTTEFTNTHASASIQVVPLKLDDVHPRRLSFIKNSGNYRPGENGWEVTVGKDMVVILMGKNLKAGKILQQKGIRSSLLADMIMDPDKRRWDLIQEGQTGEIQFIGLGDKNILLPFSRYSGVSQVPVLTTWENNVADLVLRISENQSALGLCSLGELLGTCQGKLPDGIRFVPIDKNNNSRLDPFEKIFDSPDELIRGGWAGKYPSYLCTDLVFKADARPENKAAQQFISWLLWEGQDILGKNGFCELTQNEKETGTSLLTGVIPTTASVNNPAGMELWYIVLIIIIAACVVTGLIIFSGKKHPQKASDAQQIHGLKLDEGRLTCPKGYFFDKTHTWVYMEEEGDVKVGVDDFLQHLTGTLSRVAMLEPGTKIRKGERILTLISQGKQLTIYSPVTGTIRELNALVDGDSSLLNSAPYHEGWIYRIEPSNWKRELSFLMVGATYTDWIRNELARLRDFFSMSLTVKKAGLQPVIIQDGGEITDHVLANLGPEVWEDFQCHFIDPSR